ncbi:hypothetical protein [Sinorhizobium sp. BJ1]
MANECRKMSGDIGFWAKAGLMVTAWATARRTMWIPAAPMVVCFWV